MKIDETEREDRHRLVKKSYWKGFLGSIIVVTCSLVAAFVINRSFSLSELTIHLIQAFSVIPGSAALFGVRSWDIQTWGGKTSEELLNQKLFMRISVIGLFLPVMAFSLTSSKVNESALEMTLGEIEGIENEKPLDKRTL